MIDKYKVYIPCTFSIDYLSQQLELLMGQPLVTMKSTDSCIKESVLLLVS